MLICLSNDFLKVLLTVFSTGIGDMLEECHLVSYLCCENILISFSYLCHVSNFVFACLFGHMCSSVVY